VRGHHASARLADLAVRVGRVLLYLEDRVAVDASSDSRSYTAVSLAAGDEGRWRRGGAGGDAGGYALPRPVPGSVGGPGDQARGGRPSLGRGSDIQPAIQVAAPGHAILQTYCCRRAGGPSPRALAGGVRDEGADRPG
jgi:hypothetical protein